MSEGALITKGRPGHIGRSIGALFAGFLVNVILSLGTDIGLHVIGLFPALGQPMAGGLLLVATVYRTTYGVLSSYLTARLAPDRPMGHVLVGGYVGVVLNIVAVVVTWNSGLGPHWYPLALLVLTMPTAWLGGKLRMMQLRAASSDAKGLQFSN
jgi:hypothetical protein